MVSVSSSCRLSESMGSDIFYVGKGEVTAKWMNPKVRPPPKVRPLLGPTTSWTESKTPGLTFRREVYLEGASLYLLLHMTLKLKDLLQSKRPQRARASMREAFPGDSVVGKMLAKWIANWNARPPLPRPLVPSQRLRICIAKPRRATKCVQCSLTTCV